MKRLLLELVLVVTILFLTQIIGIQIGNAQENQEVIQNLLTQPFVFEENEGQFDEQVKFVARSAGGITHISAKSNPSGDYLFK